MQTADQAIGSAFSGVFASSKAGRRTDNETGDETSDVVADGGEDSVGGVADGAGQMVAAHAMVVFEMADDRFDGGAAPRPATDGVGHAAVLAGGMALEAMRGRGVAALVAGIGDDAGERGPDLGLDGGVTVSSVWPS